MTLQALCVSYTTPGYRIDPPETVTNDLFSIYNQKYAKKTQYFAITSFCVCAYFGFLRISRKVKVLELRVVLSAYINMNLAHILVYV